MSEPLKQKNFFNFFPAPEYLLLSTSGIAVTDDSIRFTQFRRGVFGTSLKLIRYVKHSLPEGVIQSGFINDAEKLTAALKEIAGYGVRFANATLPEERAYLFTATIDKVPREGLRDAVAFIVEENVPVTLADSVFDFDVVEEIESTNQIKVTVSVLAKKVVDFYIQVFEAAGITPVSFDIESQAISRAIVPRGEKNTELIINLAPNKTGFYVVEDEVVQFTTTLPYGSGEQLALHINDLKMEMNKIFSFWSARKVSPGLPERKIEKAVLCGPGALNDSFVAELMKDCPVPHSLANVWANTSKELRTLPKQEISKESLEYAAAIGLALPRFEKTYV